MAWILNTLWGHCNNAGTGEVRESPIASRRYDSGMADTPLPPGALDRLAREVGKERSRTESQRATAFGVGRRRAGDDRAVSDHGAARPRRMGVVYQALDPERNIEVALKSLAAGPGDRMKREGEAIGRWNIRGSCEFTRRARSSVGRTS